MTIARPLREQPHVDGVEHRFIELPDGRMHVACLGVDGSSTAEPVLLLAGFGQSWWEWREVMPTLAAAGRPVIAPDLRGEGWSELPVSGITRTVRVDDVLALLDALGLDRVHLASHDLGAITAFQLALGHSDRISTNAMLAVPPPQMRFRPAMLPGMRHLWHQEVLAIPGLGAAMMRSGRVPRHFLSSTFWVRPPDPTVRTQYLALMCDPEFARAAELLCRRVVLPELMRITRGRYRDERFTMPTLFVFGTGDVGFPPRVIHEVFADPSGFGEDIGVELVDDAGHFVIDEAPGEVGRLLVDFTAR